ncbi:polysaccharide pyruvyl transferase family protein [Candidatus Peregrinibacteria bacterium]|nr:polysaccharide pyruvyl transferase family protein [Candidatus Peregrinibacteria bacterium]
MKHYVICGNYGATNIGDEAVLDGILFELKSFFPQGTITVLSYNPDNTRCLHDVDSLPLLPFGIRSLYRCVFQGGLKKTLKAIRSCDIFFLGGGALFTDEKFFAILLWGWHFFIALLFHKPVYIYAQSLGPLDTFWGKHICRWLFFRASFLSFRDKESIQFLESLGITHPALFRPDPAFQIQTQSYHSLPFELKKGSYIVVSIRDWIKKVDNFESLLASFFDEISLQYGLKFVFLPFQEIKDSDLLVLNKIFDLVKNKKNVHIFNFSFNKNTYQDVISLIASAEMVIGMRLHCLIFATQSAIPFLPLCYSSKTWAFLRYLDYESYGLSIHDLTLDQLKEKFQTLYENRDQVRSHLISKEGIIKEHLQEVLKMV